MTHRRSNYVVMSHLSAAIAVGPSINPAVLTTGYARVAERSTPYAPDYVYKGALVRLEVSEMSCVVVACMDRGGKYVLYDGTNYSTSTDEDLPLFAWDLIGITYCEQGYTVELGDPMQVVLPVDVPVWIGIYPD